MTYTVHRPATGEVFIATDDLEAALRVSDELRALGETNVHFTSGEPSPARMCLCGRTDYNSESGFWRGCPNSGCAGVDYSTIDPADGRYEFDPNLERMVLPLLDGDWVCESGSPGGDFVLWQYVDTMSIGVSPHPDGEQQVRWVLGVYDDMGGPLGDQLFGPAVNAPALEVASWVNTELPGLLGSARAAFD